VRGNLGVQASRDQESEGKPRSTAACWAPITGGANYTDILPSLNLNFDLGNYLSDTNLRFGAAKTVARPQHVGHARRRLRRRRRHHPHVERQRRQSEAGAMARQLV
jgi:hypothetical protein